MQDAKLEPLVSEVVLIAEFRFAVLAEDIAVPNDAVPVDRDIPRKYFLPRRLVGILEPMNLSTGRLGPSTE